MGYLYFPAITPELENHGENIWFLWSGGPHPRPGPFTFGSRLFTFQSSMRSFGGADVVGVNRRIPHHRSPPQMLNPIFAYSLSPEQRPVRLHGS
jgi:hypothetical protein